MPRNKIEIANTCPDMEKKYGFNYPIPLGVLGVLGVLGGSPKLYMLPMENKETAKAGFGGLLVS